MRKKIYVFLPLLFLHAVIYAENNTTRIVTFDIKEHTVQCYGIVPQRCLLVKEPHRTKWEYFYDAIEGFDYEKGYRYRIVVEKKHIRNANIQDRSAYRYRLLRILKKIEIGDYRTDIF
jgi:hypothetical protein